MCEAMKLPPSRPGIRSRYRIPARPTTQRALVVQTVDHQLLDHRWNHDRRIGRDDVDDGAVRRDDGRRVRRARGVVAQQAETSRAAVDVDPSRRTVMPCPDSTATDGSSAGKIASRRKPSRSTKNSTVGSSVGARQDDLRRADRSPGRASVPDRRQPDCLSPRGERLADLVGAVLLDEVVAGDGDLGLVGPRPAELALGADEDRAGLGVHEQLRHVRGDEPVGVAPARWRRRRPAHRRSGSRAAT